MLSNLSSRAPVKKDLKRFIALAPCVALTSDKPESYYENGLYKFLENEIYSIFGPYWDEELPKICKNLPKEVCEEWTTKTINEFDTIEPTSAKNLIYLTQNGFQGRYQKYAPNYLAGEKQTDLIDLAKVSDGVSIAMFMPVFDEMCPFKPLAELKTDYTKFMPVTHNYFTFGA